MITFSHLIDTPNLGDRVCCPADYFDEFKDCPRVDMRERIRGPVVYGGGGILFDGLSEHIEEASFWNNDVVLWGVGSNTHDSDRLKYPPWLKRIPLVGIRDVSQHGFESVPCPTCMAPGIFTLATTAPDQDIGIYEHWERPLSKLRGRRRCNAGAPEQFGSVLNFLARHETIITNTYHGAYWSYLLGRKVMICDPFSSRFFSFGFDVAYTTEDTAMLDVARATCAPHDYLDDCREKNVVFAKKVTDFAERFNPSSVKTYPWLSPK